METSDFLDQYVSIHGEVTVGLHHGYSLAFFSKLKYIENDIFVVYAKGDGWEREQRAGWLFPVNIMLSREYDLFGNSHLNIYLDVFASYLMGAGDICDDIINDESAHVLILKDQILIERGFLIDSMRIALHAKGYYSFLSEINFSNSQLLIERDSKKIVLKVADDFSKYNPYIRKLLLDLLPNNADPLSRFISLYQFFEVVMEKFFHEKIEAYKARRLTIGTIREHISEFSNERKLINSVFCESGFRQQATPTEVVLAKRLFGDDRDDSYYGKLTLPVLIYDVRNAIVHNYHKYELSELMIEISEWLEVIVLDMLGNSQVERLVIRD